MIGFNKVFFTHAEYGEFYRAEVETALDRQVAHETATSEFAGHDVGWWRAGAKNILRRSEFARTLYHGAYRKMVRGLQLVSGRKRKGYRRVARSRHGLR